ncbi:hypothetical protein L486_04417 [Kwoniella mangroviensis CBS 10435]|uniref:HhH-GPD domain-containing protein n=1 Tax=Kwoniella mangroviensis CBS 10435 TaxID=1331196 RepID=A0A1B9ISJ7_9TREE|nr:uncharacterized protein I203_02491 [Kwoniella mangroviensis CBS 8507]OCF58384.1 hypothetical protein L486_04417 [Kwoniella mangroviensis CBS 10435]OCF67835.1 hypothetical protein I203_02491 [Kwoniella mangroviensis CBS 8507]OCF78393.1 hypothetical protein I204_00333 [Kwoniella mangroviensis CBS 8886]
MSPRQPIRRSSRKRSLPLDSKSEPPVSSPNKIQKIKAESPIVESPIKVKQEISPKTLKDRKLKAHAKDSLDGPFPSYIRPTPSECSLAHEILSSMHGPRIRPKVVVASKDRAGCGDSPSVLDALVRTILSQNTSDKNSTRAKINMDNVYGGSDHWEEIVAGGQEKLQEAIKSGGLSQVKSKVILQILAQAKEKYGDYSLDHLHKASTEDAMEELLGFDGVGPKTASCVLLFCLQREDFAVDTHVQRITGLLGWHPKTSSREQTYHHLNKRIPDEHKYGLHILFVTHGKVCDECKAGGKVAGKCALRKAFREQVLKGEAEVEEPVKQEVEQEIEQEVKQETG